MFKVELMQNDRVNYSATLTEAVITGGNPNSNQAFIAYAAKKEVEESAPLFVNFGREEDFLQAKELVTDLKKVVIARFGKIALRQMVANAMKYEAKGTCI